MSLLGLDIGTTGCKANIFDHEGNILAQAYREYPLMHPQPGWIELDPDVMWQAVEETIREAVAKVSDPVTALATSVLGEAVTPIGRDGRPLDNCMVGFDVRGVDESNWWRDKSLGAEKLYRISGQPLHSMQTIHKVMWWQKHRPEMYEQTWKFMCWGELALYWLGAPPTIDYSMASRTLALDISTKQWSAEVLEAASIAEGKLPAVAPSGTAVGTINPEMADRLGLPRKVVLCTGGHDQPCGALGAGVVDEGSAMYAIGTVECVTLALESFKPNLGSAGFSCYPHVALDRLVTLAFNFTGGSLLRWYRDNFGRVEIAEAKRTGQDAYDLMIADMPAEPTELYVVPHFAGTGTPWLDPLAKGAIYGLTLGTRRQDILRAVLEGVTYEIAVSCQMVSEAGGTIKELRAIGGGSKSSHWLQIKADIMNRPIAQLEITEAAGLGAAILAGAATGVYESVNDAAKSLAKVRQTFEPNPKFSEIYAERLETYRRIYPAFRELRRD
jgi:xylulokinase